MKIENDKTEKMLFDVICEIPIVDGCESFRRRQDGFDAAIKLKNGTEIGISVFVATDGTGQELAYAIEDLKKRTYMYGIIIIPFFSAKVAKLCEEQGIGYVDLEGNVFISVSQLYIKIEKRQDLNRANKKKAVKHSPTKRLFHPGSVVSSLVLRKLLEDTTVPWKIKYLSEEVGCSIGMVSRIKTFLCEQQWAEMTGEGLRITDEENLLQEWSEMYSLPEGIVRCYAIGSIAAFEARLKEIREKQGIESYLTGFSGGVRYAPVVRYNKIHVLVKPEKIDEFINLTECRRVEEGANILILPAREELITGARLQKGDWVASPVQIFLDCMQIKGRGEEMAKGVLYKEIKHDS